MNNITWSDLEQMAATTAVNLLQYGRMASEVEYGISLTRFRLAINKLRQALGRGGDNEELLCLAAGRIEKLTTALEDIAFAKTDSEAAGYQDVLGCIKIAQEGLQ